MIMRLIPNFVHPPAWMACSFGGGGGGGSYQAAPPAPPPPPPRPNAMTESAHNVISKFMPQKTRRSTILTQNLGPYGQQSVPGTTLLGTPLVAKNY